jgi:hypothetical protein
MMTARFDTGLSRLESVMLSVVMAGTLLILFPGTASAQTENKTSFVLEIKTIKIPQIPSVHAISNMINEQDDAGTSSVTPVPTPPPAPIPATVEPKAKTTTIVTTSNGWKIPAKKVGAERVYMHEPEIRAYICPKLGDKCNTFIAILAAENGTHECTRDNRGTNRNGTIDIGLTQINWSPSSPYTFEQLQDCKFNLDIAMKKYEARGFQPWAAYNSGRYKKHLPAILASAAALEAAAKASVETAVLD